MNRLDVGTSVIADAYNENSSSSIHTSTPPVTFGKIHDLFLEQERSGWDEAIACFTAHSKTSVIKG